MMVTGSLICVCNDNGTLLTGTIHPFFIKHIVDALLHLLHHFKMPEHLHCLFVVDYLQ